MKYSYLNARNSPSQSYERVRECIQIDIFMNLQGRVWNNIIDVLPRIVATDEIR